MSDVKSDIRVHVRWLIRRDMPEILTIEQDSFQYHWTEEDFLRELRSRVCIGMVAEHGERVVGFAIYQLRQKSLHLLNLAVHPRFRRKRVAAQLLTRMIAKLPDHNRTHITLEVRDGNLPAQLFFRAMGFRALRVLRDFFDDTGEDAYLMRYLLPGRRAEEDSPADCASDWS